MKSIWLTGEGGYAAGAVVEGGANGRAQTRTRPGHRGRGDGRHAVLAASPQRCVHERSERKDMASDRRNRR